MAKQDEISSTERLLDLIRGKSVKDSDSSVAHSPHSTATAKKLSFLKAFSFKRKLIVGVDIGLKNLRLAKISRSADKQPELLECLRVPFDPNIPKRSPRFHQFLKSVLDKFCDSSETTEIWSAISSVNVETRYLRIPKVPKKQMFKAVFWTYKKDISFNEQNDIFDYEILDDILEDGVPKTEVMACSAPKREVEDLKNIFSKSGYPLTGVSIVPFALQNLFKTQWLQNGKNVCSLFVGSDWSRIAVYSNGNLVLSRGVKSGIQSMVEAIREEIDSNHPEQPQTTADDDSPSEFENYDNNHDSDSDPALELLTGFIDDTLPLTEEETTTDTESLFGTIQPALDRIIRQVERTLRHYTLNFGDTNIGKVYISGKISSNRHVVDYIGEQLGIPVENLDPFTSPKYISAVVAIPEPESERGAFVPAVGMALSNNSITPNFMFTYKDKDKVALNVRIERVMLGIFLLLIAAGVGFFLWQSRILDQKKTTVAQLQKQMAKYSPVVDQNLIIQMVSKAQRNIDTAEAYVKKYYAMAMVSEIVQITPSEIFLTNITAQLKEPKSDSVEQKADKGLVLEGIIFGERLVTETLLAEYLIKLKSSPMFTKPVIKKKYYQVIKDQEVLRFTAVLRLV